MNSDKDTKLSTTDKILHTVLDKLVPARKLPLEDRLARLTEEQAIKLQQIENEAIKHFVGNLDDLESALGMLRIGHHFGWRVLYIIHSKKTIRKYESILDFKVRDLFPEEGPSAPRSLGLGLAKEASNFWKVVSGEIKIDHKRDIE